MTYNLYQDSARSTLWGNTSGTAPSAVAGTGTNADITVYGRVDAGQNLPVAVSYTDTVVATVTF
jgi:spore coat protein U-like protein